jgi:hypothetical protein
LSQDIKILQSISSYFSRFCFFFMAQKTAEFKKFTLEAVAFRRAALAARRTLHQRRLSRQADAYKLMRQLAHGKGIRLHRIIKESAKLF